MRRAGSPDLMDTHLSSEGVCASALTCSDDVHVQQLKQSTVATATGCAPEADAAAISACAGGERVGELRRSVRAAVVIVTRMSQSCWSK